MAEEQPTQEVVVRDVQMRFGSMVIFMVKWAIASIPALIILIFLTVATIGFATGLFGSLGHVGLRGTKSAAASSGVGAKSGSAAEVAYIEKVLVRNVRVGKSVLDEAGAWGEVKNSGDRTLKKVDLVIYCLGADGKPVFEKTFSPVWVTEVSMPGDENEPLKPGYSRQFGVKLDDAPSDWSKRVEVKVTGVEFQ